MTIEQRKHKLQSLGRFLSQFTSEGNKKLSDVECNEPFFEEFALQIDAAVHHNGWFTKENVIFSLQQWSNALTKENLNQWLQPYQLDPQTPKTIGIIMAGNIPLVGFHDFLSVLVSGHKVLVKQSSNDNQLLPIIAKYLGCIAPEWKDSIAFISEANTMENYDAIIATGSNNTARYFEYYFKGKPSIIRKNRNSVAILNGEESEEELTALGEDIFRYYGLGCRNVSKLYVPEDYDFDSFFKAMYPWGSLINHNKYANNYDYNKAVYLMSLFKLLENGFLILKEDDGFGSPISVLFYERYSDAETLQQKLSEDREAIQCIVGNTGIPNQVAFGTTQHPQLWDYADEVDTLRFLEGLG